MISQSIGLLVILVALSATSWAGPGDGKAKKCGEQTSECKEDIQGPNDDLNQKRIVLSKAQINEFNNKTVIKKLCSALELFQKDPETGAVLKDAQGIPKPDYSMNWTEIKTQFHKIRTLTHPDKLNSKTGISQSEKDALIEKGNLISPIMREYELLYGNQNENYEEWTRLKWGKKHDTLRPVDQENSQSSSSTSTATPASKKEDSFD